MKFLFLAIFVTMSISTSRAAVSFSAKWGAYNSGALCYLYANDVLTNESNAIANSVCRLESPTTFQWTCFYTRVICSEMALIDNLEKLPVCQSRYASGKCGYYTVSETYCSNTTKPSDDSCK